MDYTAEVSVGMSSIQGFEFKTKLVLEYSGNHFPLVLYMECPARHGQNADKLMLVACKTVPPQARNILHPSAFRPRETSPGWVTDTRRDHQLWRP